MTRTMGLLLVLLGGCGRSAPPTPPPVDDPAPPEAPAPEVDGELTLGDRQVPVGGTLTVRFDRPGRNGCYRQTEPETVLGDHTITHSYRTSYEDGMCTQALVPGGFTTQVTLPEAGTWRGRVVVDGEELATYTVEAVPS